MINHWVPLISILIFFTKCGADSSCCQNISLHYLEEAVELIGKAKYHFPSRDNCKKNHSRNPLDCSQFLEMGYKENGIYRVWPQSRVMNDKPLDVYCDMKTDGGGWTLIQRRGPFGREKDFFYKDWKSYKEGFGDMNKDFWLGNDNIYALTNQRLYSARFDLKAMNNEARYAHYDTFWIDDEYSKYTLHIADYRGDAGDSMGGYHSNQKFSTKDQDNDNSKDRNCVAECRGGWWYYSCYRANLNGQYLNGKPGATGMHWNTLTQHRDSLKSTEIKIRPRNFKLPRDILKTRSERIELADKSM